MSITCEKMYCPQTYTIRMFLRLKFYQLEIRVYRKEGKEPKPVNMWIRNHTPSSEVVSVSSRRYTGSGAFLSNRAHDPAGVFRGQTGVLDVDVTRQHPCILQCLVMHGVSAMPPRVVLFLTNCLSREGTVS